MAKKACCLRLKGFTCQLPKKDMRAVAEEFCNRVGIAKDDIVTVHSSGIAQSCVIEFLGESFAKRALELSRAPELDSELLDPKT